MFIVEKILLAIQEYSTLRTFSSFVNEDYKVICCSNEVDAINSIQNQNFALIIVDLTPSKIDGQAVLRYLYETHQIQNQPVSVILNNTNLQTEIDLFNVGCAEIFTAPFDSILTRRRIQNVITIHNLKKHVAVYEQKLTTDPLTGLLNKDGFQAKVRKRLKSKKPGAFLMCDLDGLKYINDNFSHQTGDQIIQGVGKVLAEVTPEDSYVAHISGDEFCVFISDVSSQDEIAECCTQIQKTLLSKVLIPDLSRPVTVSIGIALYPEVATTYENLHFKADHALLFVKNHGKNGFKFHAPRDDREEMLKGRQECTNIPVDLMLKKRDGEDIQTWLKFGEFRIVYITYKKYGGTIDAHLCQLNIIDKKNPDNPDSKKVLSLNEKITTFIKEAEYGGIFSWYSINQLLILSVKKETLPQGVDHLKEELASEISALQLDIEFIHA